MVITRILAVSIAWTVMATTPASSAIDLSKYRVFEFGSSLANVARQAGISAEPRVVHQRPEIYSGTDVAASQRRALRRGRRLGQESHLHVLQRSAVSNCGVVRSREDAGADFRRPRRSGFRDVRRVDASRSGDHVPGDAAGHTREVRRAVGGPAGTRSLFSGPATCRRLAWCCCQSDWMGSPGLPAPKPSCRTTGKLRSERSSASGRLLRRTA